MGDSPGRMETPFIPFLHVAPILPSLESSPIDLTQEVALRPDLLKILLTIISSPSDRKLCVSSGKTNLTSSGISIL
jgi:hypothetical protein